MTDNRKYDAKLVEAIRAKEHFAQRDGLQMLMKPIPDDSREHVLDPRVRATVERKRKMFADRAQKRFGAFSLADERYRPDKVTYDLTSEPILQNEQLIDVNSTHKIDVFTYCRSERQTSRAAIVFLHGGGYTAGNERIYHNQMLFLAEKSNAVVVFPEYRLAPECPFPGAIEDCYATVEWLANNAEEIGIDSSKIMVGGDSAGGSLTLSCLLEDQERAHVISRAYLLFPGTDVSDYRSAGLYDWSWDYYPIDEEERDLAQNRINRIKKTSDNPYGGPTNLWIQGKTTLDDPLVSPVYASDDQLRKFPPITVAVSEYDFLRIAAEYLARRLVKLGRPVRPVMYCGCDHGFLDLFGTEPQAEEVCMDIADEAGRM